MMTIPITVTQANGSADSIFPYTLRGIGSVYCGTLKTFEKDIHNSM